MLRFLAGLPCLSSALSPGVCHCGEGVWPVHPDCPGFKSRVHSLLPLWDLPCASLSFPMKWGCRKDPRS